MGSQGFRFHLNKSVKDETVKLPSKNQFNRWDYGLTNSWSYADKLNGNFNDFP